MKIYSFDGKKRIIDNFDDDLSPMFLGQKFIASDKEEKAAQEIDGTDEKQIEK